MIITVTVNPLIDRMLRVQSFTTGKIHRTQSVKEVVGGKGLNVARMLTHLDHPVHAFSFAGGGYGEQLEHLLDVEHIPHTLIQTIAPTRFQVSIIDTGKSIHTDVIDNATLVSPEEADTLYYSLQLFLESQKDIECLILSGSAPSGIPLDFYQRLLKLAHQRGITVCLDSYGEIFVQALKEQPQIIKPNLEEAENLSGKKLAGLHAQIDFLHQMQGRGIQLPILSLGDRGALVLSESAVHRSIPPAVHAVNTTGSGDAFVAMMTHKLSTGSSVPEALKYATAAGTANALAWEPCGCLVSDIEEILPHVQIKKIS